MEFVGRSLLVLGIWDILKVTELCETILIRIGRAKYIPYPSSRISSIRGKLSILRDFFILVDRIKKIILCCIVDSLIKC